jgi:surface protein
MSKMFSNCWSLNDLDILNLDTKNVTNMSLIFYKCKSLKYINLTNFETKNVKNMSRIFYGCSYLIIKMLLILVGCLIVVHF